MDRKQFREIVAPLSEKEIYYRDHPEMADEYYRTHSCVKDSDGIYRFVGTEYQGAIADHVGSLPVHNNIILNKQTRYSRVPLHRHGFLELFFVYEGSCVTDIKGSRVPLVEGDVCIMDVDAVHAIDPIGDGDIVMNLQMKREYFNSRFISRLTSSGAIANFLANALMESNSHDQYLLFHTNKMPVIRTFFEDIFCEYLEPGICCEDLLDSYMTLIFIQLARCYQAEKELAYRDDSRSYMTEVLRYIGENCADCTLENTAARFNFHPNYLSRVLKKTTGLSFKKLTDRYRLERAAFLLQNTNQPISAIALQCGWTNQNQFYKKFTDHFTCSPREYRMENAFPG